METCILGAIRRIQIFAGSIAKFPSVAVSVVCLQFIYIYITSRVPNHQKYRKMVLIIFIISLGQILLSYIANTSRTHTHTRTHAHTRAHAHIHPPPSPFRLSLFDGSVRPTMMKLTLHFRWFRWR